MLKLFTRDDKHAHPLADAKELKQVLAGLPAKDDVRALDELAGWMESVGNSDGLAPGPLFDIARQLDEAAQSPMRHLTRTYLAPSQRTRVEEQKLWKLCADYWLFATVAYRRVIDTFIAIENEKSKSKQVDALRAQLPLVLARHAAAAIAGAKWRRFHHEPPLPGIWADLGRNFLFAEARKIDGEAATLYPLSQIVTTPRREYIKAVALEASSLDSLLPVQIEVAEKLVAHFSPQFVLSRENREDNLYWVDASLDQVPQRLARLPKGSPGVRLLGFGEVPASVAAITREVERGELPAALNMTGLYTPKLVLSVLRHLATYWTPTPPLRKHQRHQVSSRLIVDHGFDACYQRMGGADGGGGEDELDFCSPSDEWKVGDVSLGGFGVNVPGLKKDWLRVGSLLVMRPADGDKWMVGVVRRFQRGADNMSSVGVQTLARQVECLELSVAGTPARSGMRERAIMIDPEDAADGVRLLLPPATFDLRESYTALLNGRNVLLYPVELQESGTDYQLCRFRLRYSS